MRSDYKKATQIINYLVRQDGATSDFPELKVIKLIWAADRYHLRKYARTVSHNDYWAMKQGPVGGLVKDITEFSSDYLSEEEIAYAERFIKSHSENDKKYVTSINEADMNELSETDVEALNFAWEKFGKYDIWAIVDITHEYPEWKKHEPEIKAGKKRVEMDLTDFFDDPEIANDPFKLDKKIIANSREVFSEYR
jgi:uncharacterized phage-associated protein